MNSPGARREFMKRSAVAAAGLLAANCGTFRAARSSNDKLNIAIIGCGGRGRANTKSVKTENIVALCDVDENALAAAAKQFPKAKICIDWRKCLDQKDIDAAVCSTTDHTHAFVNIWAINRGLHVYCEKPMANSVEEARVLRETYLKNKGRVATQMGVQRHAMENMSRVVELVKRGAIGVPQKVYWYDGARNPVCRRKCSTATRCSWERCSKATWDICIATSNPGT